MHSLKFNSVKIGVYRNCDFIPILPETTTNLTVHQVHLLFVENVTCSLSHTVNFEVPVGDLPLSPFSLRQTRFSSTNFSR